MLKNDFAVYWRKNLYCIRVWSSGRVEQMNRTVKIIILWLDLKITCTVQAKFILKLVTPKTQHDMLLWSETQLSCVLRPISLTWWNLIVLVPLHTWFGKYLKKKKVV